jgi:hypothetical protein
MVPVWAEVLADDERCLLQKLPTAAKVTLGLLGTSSLIIGTLMKSLIFRNLWRTKLASRPINLLILLEELSHLVKKSFVYIYVQTYAI